MDFGYLVLRCVAGPALKPILPRLALIAFTYSQSLLADAMLQYLSSTSPISNGYGLIGACVFVYVGIVVGQCIFPTCCAWSDTCIYTGSNKLVLATLFSLTTPLAQWTAPPENMLPHGFLGPMGSFDDGELQLFTQPTIVCVFFIRSDPLLQSAF